MYIVLCVKGPMILDIALAYLRGGYCPKAHTHIGADRSKRKPLTLVPQLGRPPPILNVIFLVHLTLYRHFEQLDS